MPKNPLKLKICYLYPDILQSFCDDANVETFVKRAIWRNIDVQIDKICANDRITASKYDFYYIGFNDNYDDDIILTASCALEFKKDKERDDDLIIHWGSGNEEKEQDRWRNIRKKLIEYLDKNKDEHLIYCQDIVLDNEHLIEKH